MELTKQRQCPLVILNVLSTILLVQKHEFNQQRSTHSHHAELIQHILSRSHRVSFYLYSFFGKWDSHRGEIRFWDSQRHLCKLNVTLAPGIHCVEVTAERNNAQSIARIMQSNGPSYTIYRGRKFTPCNKPPIGSKRHRSNRDLIQETHFSVRKFVPSALASLTKQREKTMLDRRTRRVVGTSNLRHNAITNTSNLQFLLTLAHPPWKLCPKSSCVTLRITIMKESRGT